MSTTLSLLLPRRTRLAVLAAVLAVLVLGVWLAPRFRAVPDPLLATPRLALERLEGGTIYYNAAALPWLVAQRPEFVAPEDRDGRSERAAAFAQAVLNPKLFRQLDRKFRFDALLLVGDPSQYRTLLDHLVETKDFVLHYADHTSLIFRRGGTAWTPRDLDGVRSRLSSLGARARAQFLALTATKLTAARRQEDAKPLLDEALALDSRSAEAWSALAAYRMERGDWVEALKATEQALSIDKNHLGALATRTQVLYATRRFDAAYALSQRLVERLPDDPNVLFKHAQIAHEAHAYKTEIAALDKLIALADAAKRPTTGYRLYLAQAHTAAGNGQPALENFTRVLEDPELPEDQRRFATEAIERIKRRTGL
jgi:tetratricopeptide (TPR) repeat protein